MAAQNKIEDDVEDGVDVTANNPSFQKGMFTHCKNLYQKADQLGRNIWVDEFPKDLTAAGENSETEKCALLIRNIQCYGNSRKTLKIDSIVVQSPPLKQVLGHILQNSPGVNTSLDRLTFDAPFKPFVHRWKKVQKSLEDEWEPEAKAHLRLLYDVLSKELHDDLKALNDYILNGVITFTTGWMIFEPGDLVFGAPAGQPAVARLDNSAYLQSLCSEYFALQCRNGEYLGYEQILFKIDAFDGTAKITKLTAFPLEYHRKKEKVTYNLIERGIAMGEGPWGPLKYNVDGRIIIGTHAWDRFNPNKQVFLSPLDNKAKASSKATQDDNYGDNFDSDDGYISYGEEDDSSEDLSSGMKNAPNDNGVKVPPQLTETQLLLCGSTLRGYSFKNKKWLTFFIDCVRDIVFNDKAFSSLVLPHDHKELILALSESQVKNKGIFDDVIQGKGKGMVMLLSGPPGVGKTLTAESVAERMRAPLYMMSAGDLGLHSAEVESSLSNVLEMATKWNAILLLDEADVFLEQRSSNDLERNKLVSIFLHLLEYYGGILFLTTNRVDNVDTAFQSRTHISMQYDNLRTSARKSVWMNFLNASTQNGDTGFTDGKLKSLAERQMNGREIKNVIKTAKLLASHKHEELGVGHVESVLAIEQRHVEKMVQ